MSEPLAALPCRKRHVSRPPSRLLRQPRMSGPWADAVIAVGDMAAPMARHTATTGRGKRSLSRPSSPAAQYGCRLFRT